MSNVDQLIKSTVDYYNAQGADNDCRVAKWLVLNHADIGGLHSALERAEPKGHVLDLGCGTGWLWTDRLKKGADTLTCVDNAPKALALHKERFGADGRVKYVPSDIFQWTPPKNKYDFVLMALLVTHIPDQKFDSFWKMVASALAPDGRVFFVANQRDPQKPDDPPGVSRRRYPEPDGNKFEIIKIMYRPGEFEEKLRSIGWQVAVWETAEPLPLFFYGLATPLGS